MLEALLARHRSETVYVAWDNASTHEDEEIEAVLRGAAGRLVLLDLPTYSPWLNPIEMLWRHFRCEVTHCELFESVDALLQATQDFFDCYNRKPEAVRSIIGAHAIRLSRLYLVRIPSGRLAEALPLRLGSQPLRQSGTDRSDAGGDQHGR
ncbi:transposase [Methylobacterium nodulans]|uniref:transposase n=1 Tax=Methylobacterium nodulans TaxID=114616 RepID=UPI00016167CD